MTERLDRSLVMRDLSEQEIDHLRDVLAALADGGTITSRGRALVGKVARQLDESLCEETVGEA